jgi:hypothetical protein
MISSHREFDIRDNGSQLHPLFPEEFGFLYRKWLLYCACKYVVQYDVVFPKCCINNLIGIGVSQFPLTAKLSFDATNPTPKSHVCISSRVHGRFQDEHLTMLLILIQIAVKQGMTQR